MSYFYVICPISYDPDYCAKRSILHEIGAAYGIEPFIPLERRPILGIGAMIADMKGASFVLVDLSFERPSCYFELGVASACRASVLLIASEYTTVHQLGEDRGVGTYSNLDEYRALISNYAARQH